MEFKATFGGIFRPFSARPMTGIGRTDFNDKTLFSIDLYLCTAVSFLWNALHRAAGPGHPGAVMHGLNPLRGQRQAAPA
ncbi:MAG: hypothetical protein RSB42_08720, partial [Comamonas sp.]